MKMSIVIILIYIILFTGCSSKKYPLVSDNELKKTIVGSLITLPYMKHKEQWYFHENGNIYTSETRDYPYKHLEGKYYIQDGRLITIGPKQTSKDYLMELDSEGKTYIFKGVPISKQLAPIYHRLVKIDDNKYFWSFHGETNELVSDSYFDSVQEMYGRNRFKTKQEYIDFSAWYIYKYSQKNDREDIAPYDFNISTLSDKDINNSLIIINSQKLNKDIYLYAYNNKLYMNSSIENEFKKLEGEIGKVLVSIRTSSTIIKDNGKKINEYNPYIGLYTIGKGQLLLKLPDKRITDETINNLWLRIKYFKKLSDGLYEGCIHKIKEQELSCSENKIYILKNPNRCLNGQGTYSCLKESRLEKYTENRAKIYKSLSTVSESKNQELIVEKKLTSLYRKKLQEIIISSKFNKQTGMMGSLNAINNFFPLKISLDNNKNEFNKIHNSQVLNYKNLTYTGSQEFKYVSTHGLKIKWHFSDLEEERKNIRAESLKASELALDWLLENGKVYIDNIFSADSNYDIRCDFYGNIHISQNMIKKHTLKELELLIIHESMHAMEHIAEKAISKYKVLTKQSLEKYKKYNRFSNTPFLRIGMINSLEMYKSDKKVLDTLAERRIDFSVLRFLKSEQDRDLYCKLVEQYNGGSTSGRYRSVHALNRIIKEKYFSKLINDMMIVSIMGQMKNKDFMFFEPEKYLVNMNKYNLILNEQNRIFTADDLSRYEFLYKVFSYYFLNDALESEIQKVKQKLKEEHNRRIKEEDKKIVDKLSN